MKTRMKKTEMAEADKTKAFAAFIKLFTVKAQELLAHLTTLHETASRNAAFGRMYGKGYEEARQLLIDESAKFISLIEALKL